MSLFIVATPIGNLDDILPRALETLRSVGVILCEDTRVTKKLLSKYDIHTRMMSYHANSRDSKTSKIFDLLEEGKDLALVSDSGTPAISDPGSQLVSVVREKFGDTIKIVVIPGPSAVVTALSASGLPASDFLFLGFLPRKKGRKKLFEEIAYSPRTVVFYESPHRITRTMEELKESIDSTRKIVIARELTKIYEEFLHGTVSEILETLNNNPKKQKGEFVVMVSGFRKSM